MYRQEKENKQRNIKKTNIKKTQTLFFELCLFCLQWVRHSEV